MPEGEGPFKSVNPVGMEHFLPEKGRPAFPETDMTGVDFSNSRKRAERDLAEKEKMRAKAIESRDYTRLKALSEEIRRLKAEIAQ